jgi:P-type Cu+ transporter
MELLVSLGTSLAYFASIGYVIMDLTTKPSAGEGMGSDMGYFDTCVFLNFFILMGRLLEGWSKKRASSEVEELGKSKGDQSQGSSVDTLKLVSESGEIEQVEIELLEIGETLLLPSGQSCPLDVKILEPEGQFLFDESSLTGESIPVLKSHSDLILSSTINLNPSPILVSVHSLSGQSFIDKILTSIRSSLSVKSRTEILADKIVGYFVPALVFISLITFVAWLIRGYAGGLNEKLLGAQGGVDRKGGWTLYAVKFAVASLVVGCPCGIGLAGPTGGIVSIYTPCFSIPFEGD